MPYQRITLTTPKKPHRAGIVLVVVLVIVAVLALAAYQFLDLMMSEYKAADSYLSSTQARAAARSGLRYTAALLSDPAGKNQILQGNLHHNAQAFFNVRLPSLASGHLHARFSILSPLDIDERLASEQQFRYGLTDEAGKINLNALMKLDGSGKTVHDLLLVLPDMTEEIANAIVDWLDADDQPRAGGAESDYYQSLQPPYRAKNGPLDSLEELLLVKGMTPRLLFGNDRNRNGKLDPEEDDGDGSFNQGWSRYLTIYSRESNVDSNDNARVFVNGTEEMTKLHEKLTSAVGEDLANFVIAYELYGPAPELNATASTVARAGERLTRDKIDFQRKRLRSLESLYDLLNSKVLIPDKNSGKATAFACPLNDPESVGKLLPLVLDKLTAIRESEIPGRINVNTASKAILLALPGLSGSDVQNILAQRPKAGPDMLDPLYQTPAWLITKANLKPQTLRTLDKYITTRSQVYAMQVLGYLEEGGPSARFEAVLDTNKGHPQVVYWRDLTELGKGFDLPIPEPDTKNSNIRAE